MVGNCVEWSEDARLVSGVLAGRWEGGRKCTEGLGRVIELLEVGNESRVRVQESDLI